MESGHKKDKNIFLIGFMGVGKSTIAEKLSTMLQCPLIEMDKLIEERQAKPITQIFAEHGEGYFRDLETGLLSEFAEKPGCVVSCGGGIVVRPENPEIMKSHGTIVWLTAEPSTVYARVKDSQDRPVLNGNMNVEYIATLMEKRRALYEAAADLIIKTDGKSAEQICEEIQSRCL